MRLSIHRPRAARLRVAVAGLTGSALIAAAFTGATAPASAAGLNLLASSTSVGGQLSDDGNTIAVSVTVTPQLKLPNLNLGLKVAPTGTVTFGDDKGDYLGAVTLPACLLTSCSTNATIDVDALSDGVTYITASYPGDLVLKPSVGAFGVSKSDCSDEGDCEIDVDSGTTQLEADDQDGGGDGSYIVGTLGGPGLPCSVGGGAAVANVNGHNLSGRKNVVYDLNGDAATAYINLDEGFFDGDDGSWICWVSPNEFTAYSDNGSTTFPQNQNSYNELGDAPQLTSGPYAGDYVGLLDWCSDLDSSDPSPCLEYYNFGVFEETGPTVSVQIDAPGGDPHAGG